jgi:hypothetical protein
MPSCRSCGAFGKISRKPAGELGRKIDSHSEKLDSIEGYLVYQLGLSLARPG